MTIDFGIREETRQLRRVGLRPPERLVRNILWAGDAAYEPLLKLATSVDLLHLDEPECFGPLHALRLLGDIPRVEMIGPLLNCLPIQLEYPDEQIIESWVNELPQILARIGPPAIEPLWAIADHQQQAIAHRSMALMTLAYISVFIPESYEAIAAELRERLGREDNKTLNSYIVIALGDLGVKDAYGDVMALYPKGQLDAEIIPAGLARQMLLSNSDLRLEQVRYTFWERYERLGPFKRQEEG